MDETNELSLQYENDKMGKKDFMEYISSSLEVCGVIINNLQNASGLVHSLMQVSSDQINEEKRYFENL